MLSGIEIFNFFVSDHLKADFMHSKRTNSPIEKKIGKHLEELKQCTNHSPPPPPPPLFIIRVFSSYKNQYD